MDNDFYYDSIPIGRENAITRQELAILWDTSCDAVRHKIAELRSIDNGDDYIIFSSSKQDSPGYYKTDDPAERRAFVAETKRRAINTFKPLKKAQRIERGEIAGQMSMANNLRNMRQAKGVLGKGLVDALRTRGVYMDVALLSRIENGVVLPTPDLLAHIAEILECEPEELFDFKIFLGETAGKY